MSEEGDILNDQDTSIDPQPSCWRKFIRLIVLGWHKLLAFYLFLNITVEPLMFILAGTNTARSIVTPYLAKHKMMRYYNSSIQNMTHDEESKYINKKMVEWDNNFNYVNLPIACIVGIMYGGYSDVFGRKYPMLIGIVSVIVENALKICIYSPDIDWSLYVLYPTAAVSGLLGDFLLTMSCINAYVTDVFEDKKQLSVRMIIVSIAFSLGSFASSHLTKLIVNQISHVAVLGIAEGCYAFVVIAGLIFLKNLKPRKRKVLVGTDPEDTYTLLEVTKLSFYSLYDACKIFLLKRDGHKRLFLYLCFLANFLDQFVFGEEKNLIGTYTLLPPFEWTTDQYANYKSYRPIVQILGMLFGMLVFKNLLKLRDTLVICFAIGSMGLCVLTIGLAQKTWEIYASLLPGSLHGLLNPLTYTFMSCIVEPDEVGKAFAVSSIAQKLAGLAQSAILGNIYIATVDWYQGFVWILMAGISFGAVGIYAGVHVVAKRENIGS